MTLAEADVATERHALLDHFRSALGMNYSTSILYDRDPFTSLINGGVIIISKWPIIQEAQHIYHHACHYADCLAAKGVKYARINKTMDSESKVFNIFATHMQVE